MSAFSRVPKRLAILTAKASTGVGTSQIVNDYQNIMLQVTTSGSATLTVKVQGSLAAPDSPPNFASAASATNPWDFIACYDLSDPTAIITGATGVSASGTDICKNLLVNVDGIVHLNVSVTSRSAGSVNATAVVYNNQ